MEKRNKMTTSLNALSVEGNWLIHQWRNETKQTKKSKSNCQPVIFFLMAVDWFVNKEIKPNQREKTNCQPVIYLFFNGKIIFSQLVIRRKCLQQKCLQQRSLQQRGKDSTRRVPRMEKGRALPQGPSKQWLQPQGRRPETSTTGKWNKCLQSLGGQRWDCVPLLRGGCPNCCRWKAGVCVPLRWVSSRHGLGSLREQFPVFSRIQESEQTPYSSPGTAGEVDWALRGWKQRVSGDHLPANPAPNICHTTLQGFVYKTLWEWGEMGHPLGEKMGHAPQ